MLLADPDEMEIVFNNLVSNAVKYNRDGGKVTVTLEDHGKEVVIKVADTGIGISKEDQESIFEDFVRIKSSQTKDITGSGLGLSITKKMVEQYNGSILVDSVPDEGTTFILHLPRQ